TREGSGAGAGLEVRHQGSNLLLVLTGDWKMRGRVPGVGQVEQAVRGGETRRLEFKTDALGEWDSALVNFVLKCHEACRERNIEFAAETLPPGVQKLLHLALAVPEAADANRNKERAPLL